MFILEYLSFQGTEKCPQYLWKQILMSKNKSILEQVRAKQPHPEQWRVSPTAEEVSAALERMKKADDKHHRKN